jgi:hypothetical protein
MQRVLERLNRFPATFADVFLNGLATFQIIWFYLSWVDRACVDNEVDK